MIKGSKFRGISYKIAMGYMTDGKFTRAINEFLTIPGFMEDAQVCELLSRCCYKAGDMDNFHKYHAQAILKYDEEGNVEKAEMLRANKE
jgi:hypothetical protein